MFINATIGCLALATAAQAECVEKKGEGAGTLRLDVAPAEIAYFESIGFSATSCSASRKMTLGSVSRLCAAFDKYPLEMVNRFTTLYGIRPDQACAKVQAHAAAGGN